MATSYGRPAIIKLLLISVYVLLCCYNMRSWRGQCIEICRWINNLSNERILSSHTTVIIDNYNFWQSRLQIGIWKPFIDSKFLWVLCDFYFEITFKTRFHLSFTHSLYMDVLGYWNECFSMKRGKFIAGATILNKIFSTNSVALFWNSFSYYFQIFLV